MWQYRIPPPSKMLRSASNSSLLSQLLSLGYALICFLPTTLPPHDGVGELYLPQPLGYVLLAEVAFGDEHWCGSSLNNSL
jgi:hypothetical protein